MKFLSFNVRGLGGMVKRKEMDRLVRIEKPGFLFLQQTKLEKVDDRLCRSMWNSDVCDWIMKESRGASRGLLCVWDKMKFVKKGEFTSDGFLGIIGECESTKEKCHLMNVYAPQDR
ncbi:hypothetical protein SLE2022_099330 [Rubroshorea leprosula]